MRHRGNDEACVHLVCQEHCHESMLRSFQHCSSISHETVLICKFWTLGRARPNQKMLRISSHLPLLLWKTQHRQAQRKLMCAALCVGSYTRGCVSMYVHAHACTDSKARVRVTHTPDTNVSLYLILWMLFPELGSLLKVGATLLPDKATTVVRNHCVGHVVRLI